MSEKNHKVAKEEKISEDVLNAPISITLMRRQWIVLYNIVVSQPYKLGDARIVNEIVDKLQPEVAVDTNISKNVEEGVVLDSKN